MWLAWFFSCTAQDETTPLHVAAEGCNTCHIEVVKYLLKTQAGDKDATDKVRTCYVTAIMHHIMSFASNKKTG